MTIIKKVLIFAGKVFNGIVSVLIENGKLSIGRLLLISVFILALVRWSQGVDIPTTMVTILMSLLGYVLGSKFIGNATDIIKDIKKSTTNIVNQFTETTNVDNGNAKTPDIEE